jgi:hypothetical protein
VGEDMSVVYEYWKEFGQSQLQKGEEGVQSVRVEVVAALLVYPEGEGLLILWNVRKCHV